ncbi:hypothetical protein BLAT2472_40172 [Burkholderia latens]
MIFEDYFLLKFAVYFSVNIQ